MNWNKGSVDFTSITLWALGAITSVAVASSVAMNGHLAKLDDQHITAVENISRLNTESTRYQQDITELKAKMDALLWANGINPSKVEINKSVAPTHAQ